MLLTILSSEPLGDLTGNAEGNGGGGDDQQCQRQQIGANERPAIDDTHCRGNEQNRQNGGHKTAHFPDLLQLHDLQAQCYEKQRQTIDRCGDGQGDQALEGFTQQGEAHNDEKL